MSPNAGIKVDGELESDLEPLIAPQAAPRKYDIVYFNAAYLVYWHLAGLYGIYLCFNGAKLGTIVFTFIMFMVGEIGATAGAHRLWSHRSYKAKRPLQILLMLMTCIAFQNTAFDWARNHRVHHRYSDTDADPHNATRGFFFSHYGWVVVRKHPEIKRRGKFIDISDLYANPVLMFQKKYAIPLFSAFCFILPTLIPVYLWGETLWISWHLNMLRYIMTLNATFLINSAAHKWGYRPYDKTIYPVENKILNLFVFGEGYHNYHHAFPWDYKAAELINAPWNITTKLIEFFGWIGWAYDFKTVPDSVVKKRMLRMGDGTDCYGNKLRRLSQDVVDASEDSNVVETKC